MSSITHQQVQNKVNEIKPSTLNSMNNTCSEDYSTQQDFKGKMNRLSNTR